ncbi:MAG: phosphodiester glycosidase family protein, partial [Janthinobacterium lividum]
MIVDGKIFSSTQTSQRLLIIEPTNIIITRAIPAVTLKLDGKIFSKVKINNFADKNSIIIYNDRWGSTTLSPYEHREIIVDSENKIINISTHSDNDIPKNGYVVSLPNIHKNLISKFNNDVEIDFKLIDNLGKPHPLPKNMLTGIPQIVKNKQIDNLSNSSKALQARTALGVGQNGEVIIAVVEHIYKQDLTQITLGQVQNILKHQKDTKLESANLNSIKNIVEKSLHNDQELLGLNLIELAQIMIEFGCVDAINLDGGGFSTMYLNGRVVIL